MPEMNRFMARAHGHGAVLLRARQPSFSDIHVCMRAIATISNLFAERDARSTDKARQSLVFRRFVATSRQLKVILVKIRVGYEMLYEFPRPTPIIMVLGTHFTRASDLI